LILTFAVRAFLGIDNPVLQAIARADFHATFARCAFVE
jgi:hypothetical protein